MTDRIRYLFVMLEADYRDAEAEELEKIIGAISLVRGVKRVTKGKPVDADTHLARSMLAMEASKRLHELADEIGGVWRDRPKA